MFHMTLQFPLCQSVQLLYLSYCSARLTAHDRCCSQLAAEMCDYNEEHADTHIVQMRVRLTNTCSFHKTSSLTSYLGRGWVQKQAENTGRNKTDLRFRKLLHKYGNLTLICPNLSSECILILAKLLIFAVHKIAAPLIYVTAAGSGLIWNSL